MIIEVLESNKDELLGGFDKAAMYKEMRVEGVDVEVILLLRCEGLLDEFVCITSTININKKLGLSNLSC